MKLHIGCGSIKKEGYINLDIISDNAGADEILDCSNILIKHPEWNGQVDEILGLHVFEHFYYDDAITALKQYHRLLKEGGKLILEMPDLKEICKMISNGEDDIMTMAYLFGSHSNGVGQVHYWGWSPESLYKELKEIGYTKIEQKKAEDYHSTQRPCFRMEAVKCK